jgi:hypothetical protein
MQLFLLVLWGDGGRWVTTTVTYGAPTCGWNDHSIRCSIRPPLICSLHSVQLSGLPAVSRYIFTPTLLIFFPQYNPPFRRRSWARPRSSFSKWKAHSPRCPKSWEPRSRGGSLLSRKWLGCNSSCRRVPTSGLGRRASCAVT